MRIPILIVHVTAGIVGMLSGAVAISFRKGSRGHVVSGEIFVTSMLIMGICATYLAVLKHQTNNIFGGLLAVYMIGTAWLTARRPAGETSPFDWGGFLFALAIGALSVMHGYAKATGRVVTHDGVPFGMDVFMGCVMLLAAGGDLRMLLRGGVFGKQRLTRHLWRMCFGWFIATGSFFLGQQQVFPQSLRGSSVLTFLAVLPLLLLIFWIIRVRFAGAYQRKTATSAG